MGRLSEIVGCKIPWDIWGSPSVPICNSLEDANRYTEKFFQLAWSELKIITKITGCLTPCTYREYEVVGKPYETSCIGDGYKNTQIIILK